MERISRKQSRTGQLFCIMAGILAIFLVAGCTNGKCVRPGDRVAGDAFRDRAGAIGSCRSCGKVGCRETAQHAQLPPATPPSPEISVAPRSCGSSSFLNPNNLVLKGTAVLTVDQITKGRLTVKDCNGKESEVAAGVETVTTVTELPFEATVITGGNAALIAKPGEKPCDKPDGPKQGS